MFRKPLNNATAFGIVRADFNLHSVADSEAYVMNLKLPCGLGQYAMPAVQSDAKKVAAHRFGNGAKETGSRFLHYSPRMNFGTFVPTNGADGSRRAFLSRCYRCQIAWRNALSALTPDVFEEGATATANLKPARAEYHSPPCEYRH